VNDDSEDDNEEVGSIKYEGKAVAPGVLDAGKAGMALTGLDELLRYFNSRQSPELAKLDYEIPVRVREGSWEAVVVTGASAFAVAYMLRAANEIAKRDFEGVGLRDAFKKSMQAIVYLIRLAKHTSKLKGWLVENMRWQNNNTEVGIPNEEGQYEYFPTEFLDWYSSLPVQTIRKIVDVVESERELVVDASTNQILLRETITIREKRIFIGELDEDMDNEVLFPELEHDAEVKLEGRLTRGNAETNTFGLEYLGHILNCMPESGSVVQHKHALFLQCVVEGRITRLSKNHLVAERRPTIIVRRVTPLERDAQNLLF
jgi:hypothetical protein